MQLYVKVHKIYDGVTAELAQASHRKFHSVEVAFFSRWWETSASAAQRATWTQLLHDGQVEFLIGGWVMVRPAAASDGQARILLGLRQGPPLRGYCVLCGALPHNFAV